LPEPIVHGPARFFSRTAFDGADAGEIAGEKGYSEAEPVNIREGQRLRRGGGQELLEDRPRSPNVAFGRNQWGFKIRDSRFKIPVVS
jgi:hypothetical protein